MSTQPHSRYLYEFTLTRRRAMEMREMPDTCLEGPTQVCELMRALGLHEREQEHFVVFFLDPRHRLRGFSTAAVGLIDRTPVHPREVFRNAVLNGSSRILVGHNHPSGGLTPSNLDIDCTKQLVEAGKILGIEVLDHVIVGDTGSARKGYFSFREKALI